MNKKKYYGKCIICGSSLKRHQTKYCCKKCYFLTRKSISEKRTCLNPECGKEFMAKKRSQKYCCEKCGHTGLSKKNQASLNRPYTNETVYLIKLWLSQGDSLERIALALGRSLKNVKQALE